MMAAVAAQDGDIVSYEEYQLLRVYPATAQQMQMVLDLVQKRKYEGLVSLWSQNSVTGRISGNSSNRSEPSADVLSAPQVLDHFVEQLDTSGISYDVLIHNLEVRETSTGLRIRVFLELLSSVGIHDVGTYFLHEH
jgi:hypothetical protein